MQLIQQIRSFNVIPNQHEKIDLSYASFLHNSIEEAAQLFQSYRPSHLDDGSYGGEQPG